MQKFLGRWLFLQLNAYQVTNSTSLWGRFMVESLHQNRLQDTTMFGRWKWKEFPLPIVYIAIVSKFLLLFQLNRSNKNRVHLWKVDWFTKGEYRCEVTADDFETASDSKDSDVVAVPKRNPMITGQKTRYSLGETVNLNCTSNASIPEAELSWYVNSVEVRKMFSSK